MPTMIDIGVARPRAHGQAIISTATALTKAQARAGCSGAAMAHTKNVRMAIPTTAGTKYPATSVGDFLDRRTAPLGIGHHVHDLRQYGVLADLLGHHQEGAGLVDRAADHGIVLLLLDRHRFAGNHRLIDGTLAFRDLAIHGDFLAGANTQDVALVDFFQRHFPLLAVSHDPGCGRGQGQQFPDGGSGAASGP